MKLSNIAILNIKGYDYCCITSGISKNEAINIMQNAHLTKKSRTLKNIQMEKNTKVFISQKKVYIT